MYMYMSHVCLMLVYTHAHLYIVQENILRGIQYIYVYCKGESLDANFSVNYNLKISLRLHYRVLEMFVLA